MPDFDVLIRKARATNRRRDASERRSGFASPSDGPLDLTLRTVMSALEAGIRTDDWDCIAEGFAMLEDLEIAVRAAQLNGGAQ